MDACATIEYAPYFDFQRFPRFWSLRRLPRTDPKANKTAIIIMPDEKSHGLGIKRESREKKWPISDDFG